MKLVWSQASRRTDDRPRTLLLVSVLCLFLGGVVVGAGGRDLREAPRPVRAAIASLLSTAACCFSSAWSCSRSASRGHPAERG